MTIRNKFVKEFGRDLIEELFENIYGQQKSENISIFGRVRIDDLNEYGEANIELSGGMLSVSWRDGNMNGSEIVDYSFERYERKSSKTERKFKTIDEVRKILSKVTFAPSCVNLGWQWEVKEIEEGFLIRASFQRPEVQTGIVGTGYGRWMVVNKDCPTHGIVKTVLLCVELILRHEFYEAFLYRGAQILNPHKSLTDLAHPQRFVDDDFTTEEGI